MRSKGPERTPIKLHWVTQHPTHYNALLFKAIARERSIDLTVHFMTAGGSRHPWQSNFAVGFRSRTYKSRIDFELLRVASLENADFFVIGGWTDPTCAVVVHALAARHIPFAVWTDTPAIHRKRTRLKAALRKPWVSHVLGLASHVLGTGRPALLALNEMGVPKGKLVNFPFPVDLELFAPQEQPGESEQTILVSSGRLVNSHKGFDVAIDAIGIVRDRLGYCPIRLRICGVGPDREALERQVSDQRLGRSVEFVGWLEPSQLPEFLNSAHAYLHPSRFDPFPNAVLEAMACGRAVIGSQSAGSVIDRVEHGVNGFTFPAGDAATLAELLIAAHTDHGLLATMGINARKTAECWPVDFNVAQILRLTKAEPGELISN